MSDSVTMDSKSCVPRGGLSAWLVCLSAGLFFLYEFFQLNIFDVINQPLRDDFGLNASELSWMSSAYLWADIVFLLPAGIILDRLSTRHVIIYSMLICILGTLGFAVTHSFIIASLCHFLSGIGNAFCFLSCVVLVSHWFPPRKQAFVVGSLVTMAFLGGMLAHTPFAWLYEAVGWRHALLVDGAVGSILLLWIYYIVRDQPLGVKNKIIRRSSIGNGFIQALSNPQNWLAGFFTSFLNLPIMVLCALWGTNYLQTVHHLSEMAASNVVNFIFLGSIIGCPLAGWISDSQGRRKPLMIFGAIATLLSLGPLFIPLHLSSISLSIIFFALGFFTSTQVISYPLIAESNSLEHTGSSTSIASVIIMGGGCVGQILFGWLMAHHAQSVVTNYTAGDFEHAMLMFPLATSIALIVALLIRETHCKR